METEEAWDLFRSHAADELRKSASMAGQMDTLAAQLHDIQTGVDRLTTLLPRLMGDDAAIDAANADASEAGGADINAALGAPEDDEDPFAGLGDEGGMGGAPDEAPAEESDIPAEEDERVDKAEDSDNKLDNVGDESSTDTELPAGIEPGVPEDDEDMGGDVGEDIEAEVTETPEGADVDIAEVPDDIPEEEMAVAEEPMPEAPTDDMDFYAKMLAFIIQAASKAQEAGDSASYGAIAKGAGELTKSFRDMAPALDSVMGTDYFTKACSDSTDVSGVEHPDDMMEKTDMPEGAEITDGMEKTDTKDPKMPSVEDEKGKTPTSERKLGPSDLGKSGMRMNSIRDMMEKGCAAIEDGMEKADANMPEVPETGEDRSVGGTASENAPEVPENGSDRSVGGSASVGDDGVIDPGSEKSSIQKGDGTGVTEQADDTASVLTKGQDMPGVRIQSIRDMMMYKSASRPDCIATANGDISTPEFGSPQLRKSAKGTSFRELMLAGASPEQFVEQDIARYNLFKAQGRY